MVLARANVIARLSACATSVQAVALTGCIGLGTMLPGTIYSQDGTIMQFAIEKAYRSGSVTAFDPVKQENFVGTYVGILERVTGASNATANANIQSGVQTGSASASGYGVTSFSSNIANANAYLKGDKGTLLSCVMQIEAAFNPHGIGGCDDNFGKKYRLQL
jgi:hypothetical protein